MREAKPSIKPYPEGLDCVWIASDAQGNLAAFITAGMGPIPVAVLDSPTIALENIEERLCELPAVSYAQLLITVDRPDAYLDLAARGFFVYDWTDIARPTSLELHAYEPVAIPTTPLVVALLPTDLAEVAKALRISEFLFAGSGALDVRAYLTCAESLQRR